MKFPEHYRIRQPGTQWDSKPGDDYGAFAFKRHGERIRIIATAGDESFGETGEWEHVSVSLEHRCPTWEEMCVVKDLFWDENECVVQFHPPRSEYVNNHPFCLHLWRKKDSSFPMPPSICVGIKSIKPKS